ncbi:G protein-coupled glucose receptor regulating Gpa2-domain-containing protein [Durotheca rogersii]|uniref:G protein-coupled glucose receptor regulating Gpa2-domain-containing protein n=1 Tax=Durotheca rogersii TaxID=419775 RepID=UPI00221FCF65|nr:G protein-coupled glucose receptor regulating Gpa2-domain-containing protein [Durotheca rogersii]KAI5859582.1 G protein-coupled glucose receptor regulating Gpa2-domain-containing protein [Durotheca rogersii]
MANIDDYGPLAPVSDTLSPLADSHRNGLVAVVVCGMLSFVSTTTLFLYLTYKLVTWHLNYRKNRQSQVQQQQAPANDLSLGLAQRNFGATKKAIPQDQRDAEQQQVARKGSPNQFLVLVYNLFFADMHQATAFMLNLPWAQNNEITVGIPTCWAQGWFVSTGDLAASCFICAIAVHTYFSVVRGHKPPQWALYLVIVVLWVFVYVMAIAGVAATNNGRGVGGFYVRAAAWCWINVEFESLRLWLHYFWIFLSFLVTSVLYSLIFISLRRNKAFSQPPTHGHPSESTRSGTNNTPTRSNPSGHHPAFLIYPIIYVLCTAPLALGRVVTMTGTNVSVEYFCLAGAMIASNGWLDVLLFSTTRHTIIFNASLDIENTGLETFAFMRTPHWRQYGNIVWVQGGDQPGNGEGERQRRRRRGGVWGKIEKWVGWNGRAGRSKSGGSGWVGGQGGGSQESLRGITGTAETGIQMDTVTTVVVEIEQENAKTRSREPSAHSIDSTEKVPAHSAGSLRL